MAIQWGYRPTGIQSTKNGITVPYRLIGEWGRNAARAYALANAPLILGAWYRNDVRCTSLGGGVWDVDAEYGPKDRKQPEQNDYKWTFDTTGKTKHITQGIQHIATYTPPKIKDAIEHHGAIGVTDDSVEGVDIPDRAYKWQETWSLLASSYTFAFSTVLGELTGRMNASYFRGFPPYMVQFQGATGGQLSGGGEGSEPVLRDFAFSFEVSPSETGLVIGDITGIDKIGWDYLWVRYESSDDSTSKKTTPKPIQVEVDRVMTAFNFSLLGIGTGILT
jgi:hypothetical protein